MPVERQLGKGPTFAVWAGFSLLVSVLGGWLGYGGRRLAGAVTVFAALLAIELFPAAKGVAEMLGRRLGRGGAFLASLAPVGLYLLYAAGTGTLDGKLAGLAAVYALVPAALAFAAADKPLPTVWDYLALVAIWLPVELRLNYRLFPYPPELTHTLTILLALSVALCAFLAVRRLEGVGYTIGWGRGFGFNVGFHFLVFAAIAIPLGEAIHFISWGPSLDRLRSLPIAALGILFFTAWPEEFFFRGLLQNLLAKSFKNEWGALLVASVIFGLSHIKNGGFPNWKYVALATIAGLFYGRTWMKTGSIFASCLVHAAVDITWHALFR